LTANDSRGGSRRGAGVKLTRMKRSRWLDVLVTATGEAQALPVRQALHSLNDALFDGPEWPGSVLAAD